jgi:hypothetical protein
VSCGDSLTRCKIESEANAEDVSQLKAELKTFSAPRSYPSTTEIYFLEPDARLGLSASDGKKLPEKEARTYQSDACPWKSRPAMKTAANATKEACLRNCRFTNSD